MEHTAPPPVHATRRRFAGLAGLGLLAALGAYAGRAPGYVIVPLLVVLLGGIDVLGSIVAKSWSDHRSPWTFMLGAALFVTLFWIYGVSLRHGALTTVTVGWVVVVTIGDMLLDRFHYGTHFPVSKWAAAGLVVVLLVYLLAAPTGEVSEQPHADQPKATESVNG